MDEKDGMKTEMPIEHEMLLIGTPFDIYPYLGSN